MFLVFLARWFVYSCKYKETVPQISGMIICNYVKPLKLIAAQKNNPVSCYTAKWDEYDVLQRGSSFR